MFFPETPSRAAEPYRVHGVSLADVAYLDEILLDTLGRLRAVPAAALQKIPHPHLQVWCNLHGVYGVPSTELVDWISARIAGRKAIEVGAGNGALGRALGITLTDSWAQRPGTHTGEAVRALQAEPVTYGADVLRYDAEDAVRRFRPKVVLASWVTHRWQPGMASGFDGGVREERLLDSRGVEEYIFVGNLDVHADKPLRSRPHEVHMLPGILFSRARARELNAVLIWHQRPK